MAIKSLEIRLQRHFDWSSRKIQQQVVLTSLGLDTDHLWSLTIKKPPLPSNSWIIPLIQWLLSITRSSQLEGEEDSEKPRHWGEFLYFSFTATVITARTIIHRAPAAEEACIVPSSKKIAATIKSFDLILQGMADVDGRQCPTHSR